MSASSPRAARLTYEVGFAMKNAGIGISTIVGIGGDPVIGTTFVEVLEMFENDPETEKVALLGEIGGSAEIVAADLHQERHDQAGRGIYRRAQRAARASAWAMPAPSLTGARARQKRRSWLWKRPARESPPTRKRFRAWLSAMRA